LIAFVLPTRDRPSDLARTLAGIDALGLGPDDAEVIVVDNASRVTPEVPSLLSHGVRVTLLDRPTNEGAAARNHAVRAADASRRWVVMLDDDSHPLPDRTPTAGPRVPGFPQRLEARPDDVFAVMADIHLGEAKDGASKRERGGLPEVFVGCGVAIRRDAFERAGGYDPSFGFYAEEYDLAAKLISDGGRIEFDPNWRVVHHKSDSGRDMNLIVERLVRNTAWVMQRYAPESDREAEIARVVERCEFIAGKEDAAAGFERGMAELTRTIGAQERRPMDRGCWDRFTGRAAVHEALAFAFAGEGPAEVSVMLEGKNAFVIADALRERGVEVHRGVARPGVPIVLGTMSPGPMVDGLELFEPLGRHVVAPWRRADEVVRAGRAIDRSRDDRRPAELLGV